MASTGKTTSEEKHVTTNEIEIQVHPNTCLHTNRILDNDLLEKVLVPFNKVECEKPSVTKKQFINCSSLDRTKSVVKEEPEVEPLMSTEVIETEVIENEIFSYVDGSSTVYLGENMEPVEFCEFISIKTEDESNPSTVESSGDAEKCEERSNKNSEDSSSSHAPGESEEIVKRTNVESDDHIILNEVTENTATATGSIKNCTALEIENPIDIMKQDCVHVEPSRVLILNENCGTESINNCSSASQKGTKDCYVLLEPNVVVTANSAGSKPNEDQTVADTGKKDCYVLLQRCDINSVLQKSSCVQTEVSKDILEGMKIVDVNSLTSGKRSFNNSVIKTNISDYFTRTTRYYLKCNVCSIRIPRTEKQLLTRHVQLHNHPTSKRKPVGIDELVDLNTVRKFFQTVNLSKADCCLCLQSVHYNGKNDETLIEHLHRNHKTQFMNISFKENIHESENIMKYFEEDSNSLLVCKICFEKIHSRDAKRLISHLYVKHESSFSPHSLSLENFLKVLLLGDDLPNFCASGSGTEREHSKKAQDLNSVGKPYRTWSCFTKLERGLAQCNRCEAKLTYTGGNTENLAKHLDRIHPNSSDEYRPEHRILPSYRMVSKRPKIEVITINDEALSDSKESPEEVVPLQKKKPQSDAMVKKIDAVKKTMNFEKRLKHAIEIKVWEYFSKETDEFNTARCNQCLNIILFKDDNIDTLTYHLQKSHNVQLIAIVKKELEEQEAPLSSDSEANSHNEANNLDHLEKITEKRPDESQTMVSILRKRRLALRKRQTDSQKHKLFPFPSKRIWKYYRRIDSELADCKTCGRRFVFKGRLYNLKRHLFTVHRKKNNLDTVNTANTKLVDNVSEPVDDGSWTHYVKIDTKLAKCKFCTELVHYAGSDTGELKKHLNNVHKDEVLDKLLRDLMLSDDEESNGKEDGVNVLSDRSGNDDKATDQKSSFNIENETLSYYKNLENGIAECKLCEKHVSHEADNVLNLMHHIWEEHVMKFVDSKRLFQESIQNSVKLAENKNSGQENVEKVEHEKHEQKSDRALQSVLVTPGLMLNRSRNWTYFIQKYFVKMYFLNSTKAKCKLCSTCLSFKGLTGKITSKLLIHLMKKHSKTVMLDEKKHNKDKRLLYKRQKKMINKLLLKTSNDIVTCRICFKRFTKDRMVSNDHLKEEHNDIYEGLDKYLQNQLFGLTVQENTKITRRLLNFFNQTICKMKCILCKKHILYNVGNKKNLKDHLYRMHRKEVVDALILLKRERTVPSELMVDEDMNVIVKRKPDCTSGSPQRKLSVLSYFVQMGSRGAKCTVCHKFISNKIHCNHFIPFTFSITQRTVGNYFRKRCDISTATATSWSYCSTVNQCKCDCELCFPSLVNNESTIHKFYCHHNLQRSGTSTIVENRLKNYSLLSEQYFNNYVNNNLSEDTSNKSVTSSFPISFRKGMKRMKVSHPLINSFYCYNKFQCNLCCETLSRTLHQKYPHPVSFTKDLVHLRDKHHVSSFMITINTNNLSDTKPQIKEDIDEESEAVEWTEDMSQMICSSSLDYGTIREIQLKNESKIPLLPSKQPMLRGMYSRSRKSEIWTYFNDVGGGRAICRLCQYSFSFRHGAISNLARHLRLKHAASLSDRLKNRYKHRFQKRDLQDIKPRRKSLTWNYFTKKTGDWAQCNLCNRYLSYRGGTVHNLTRHLRSMHVPRSWENDDKYNPETSRTDQDDKNLQTFQEIKNKSEEEEEQDEKKMLKRKSQIWAYFKDDATGKARCNICGRCFSYKSGSTSNLSRHLRVRHNIFIFTVPNCSINLRGLNDSTTESVDLQNGEEFLAADNITIIDASTNAVHNYSLEENTVYYVQDIENRETERNEDCKDSIEMNVENKIDISLPTSSSMEAATVAKSCEDEYVPIPMENEQEKLHLKEPMYVSDNSVVYITKETEEQEEALDGNSAAAIENATIGVNEGKYVGDSVESEQYEMINGTQECSIVEARVDVLPNGQVQYIVPECTVIDSEGTVESDTELVSKILKSLSEQNVVKSFPQQQVLQEEEEKEESVTLSEQLARLQQTALKDRRQKSIAWQYCERIGDDKAKCLLCSTVLSFKCKAVHNLTRHLFKRHPSVMKNLPEKRPVTLNLNAADLMSENNQNVCSLEVNDSCVIFIKDQEDEAFQLSRRRTDSAYSKLKTSFIWNYFTHLGHFNAKCNLCCKLLSFKGGATNNLTRHLRTRHGFIKTDENTKATKLAIKIETSDEQLQETTLL